MSACLHDGHRKRMRDKVLSGKMDSFKEHEVLEFLLFYTIPRKNTNELAHIILSEFGSLAALSNAPIDEIAKISGVSTRSAAFIKYIGDIYTHLWSRTESHSFTEPDVVLEFVRKDMEKTKEGCFRAYFLTSMLQLCMTKTICDGFIGPSEIRNVPKDVIHASVQCSSRDIIFGSKRGARAEDMLPNEQERTYFAKLVYVLQMYGFRVHECVLVRPVGSPLSLKRAAIFPDFTFFKDRAYTGGQ